MKQTLVYIFAVLVLGYLAYAYVSTNHSKSAVTTKTQVTSPVKPVQPKPPAAPTCSAPNVDNSGINNFVFSWNISGVTSVLVNPGNQTKPNSGSLTLNDGDNLTLTASCAHKTVEIQASRHGNSTNIVTNSKSTN